MSEKFVRIIAALIVGSAFVFLPLSAQAEKGGNAGSNSGGNAGGNAGGNSNNSNGKGNGSGNSTAPGLAKKPDIIVANTQNSSGANDLGRWNAAKPYDHPSIQAHIANGNFTGTIGMVAQYLVAQKAVDDLQGGTDFATNMTKANEIITAQADYEDDNTLTPPTAEDLTWAKEFLANTQASLDGLAAAETLLEQNSNQGAWMDIRAAVRAKMGLDPDDNDLAL